MVSIRGRSSVHAFDRVKVRLQSCVSLRSFVSGRLSAGFAQSALQEHCVSRGTSASLQSMPCGELALTLKGMRPSLGTFASKTATMKTRRMKTRRPNTWFAHSIL